MADVLAQIAINIAVAAATNAVANALAPTQKFEGPRLSDLRVSGSSYGNPIPLIYGPGVRIGGNVIWTTGLIERSSTQRQGGKGGGPRSETTSYSYSLSCAIALGEGRVESIRRIWANSKVIFDRAQGAVTPLGSDAGFYADKTSGTHVVFDSIRFYRGTATQPVDPTLQAALGVGNVPAYRHTSYLVINELQLADFGNFMPNIEIEVEAHSSITVADIVADICARAGATEVAATALTDLCPGYYIGRETTATQALQPLAAAYNFDLAEARGQLRFVRRGATPRVLIPIAEMGAAAASGDGREAREPIEFSRAPEIAQPREVSVTFADRDQGYQPNTQTAARRLGDAKNMVNTEIPVSLSADEGRRTADRLLWEAWAARHAAAFSVSDRFLDLVTGDPVALPVGNTDQYRPFRIAKLTRGNDGVTQVQAEFEDPAVYGSLASGGAGGGTVGTFNPPGATRLYLFNGPCLRDADNNDGYYWGATGELVGWRGSQILRSTDDGASYGSFASTGVRAPIGDVQGVMPAGPSTVWDRATVLTVELEFDDGSIESLPEDAILSGANAAWVGSANGQTGEVIQFATATLIAPKTYELRDLLRGRRGTEHAIANHGAGEVFVLLETSTVARSDFGASDWARERLFKPVSILTLAVDTPAQSFVGTGEAKRPRSPVHARATRATDGAIAITWSRRTRLSTPGLGYGEAPLGEETESYEVDILNGTGDVIRTIAASTPSISYSAAEQTADGRTPGAAAPVRIYQLSTTRGRGWPCVATL